MTKHHGQMKGESLAVVQVNVTD